MEGYEILIGTYEAFILGYKCHKVVNDDDGRTKMELRTSFANHAHCSSVRSIAAGDKYLVTAGSDENVKIFNLRNRTEHGTLTHADGVVNHMAFYDRKHLITAADDANVCILKATSGWSVEKTLCKHQEGVSAFSVHPSGKMMLSVGKDCKMVTWNLIKGRHAFVTNLKQKADLVEWSPTGSHYAVGFFKRVDIYAVSDAKVQFPIPVEGRSGGIAFLDDSTVVVAVGPAIQLWSTVSSSQIGSFDLYDPDCRIRCLTVMGNGSHLVAASNNGIVKVFRVEKTGVKFRFHQECWVDSNCRPTCMVVHKVPEISSQETKKAKAKRVKKIGFEEPELPAAKKPRAKLVVEDELDVKKAKKKKIKS